jgi:hypothetical protein
VLPSSETGSLAAFVRGHVKHWFIAVEAGTTGQKLTVPLSILGKGAYQAMLVSDRKDDRANVAVERREAKAADPLAIELASDVGFIASFTRGRPPCSAAEVR